MVSWDKSKYYTPQISIYVQFWWGFEWGQWTIRRGFYFWGLLEAELWLLYVLKIIVPLVT